MIQTAADHVITLVAQGKPFDEAVDHASFRYGVPRDLIRAELRSRAGRAAHTAYDAAL